MRLKSSRPAPWRGESSCRSEQPCTPAGCLCQTLTLCTHNPVARIYVQCNLAGRDVVVLQTLNRKP